MAQWEDDYNNPNIGYYYDRNGTIHINPKYQNNVVGNENITNDMPSSEDLLYVIAKQILNQTQPIRDASTGAFQSALAGTLDPRTLPKYGSMYSQGRDQAEGAFRSAMESAFAMPRGGQQQAAMANAALGRADAVGSLPGLIAQQLLGEEVARATGTAFGVPLDLSMGGLGNTAQMAAQRNASGIMAGAQQNAAMTGLLGNLAKSGMKMYGMNQMQPAQIEPNWWLDPSWS